MLKTFRGNLMQLNLHSFSENDELKTDNLDKNYLPLNIPAFLVFAY
jgi:hypothetical protein